jgi:hypothetical protein
VLAEGSCGSRAIDLLGIGVHLSRTTSTSGWLPSQTWRYRPSSRRAASSRVESGIETSILPEGSTTATHCRVRRNASRSSTSDGSLRWTYMSPQLWSSRHRELCLSVVESGRACKTTEGHPTLEGQRGRADYPTTALGEILERTRVSQGLPRVRQDHAATEPTRVRQVP